jgi:predicted component of type VI protein secretion system
MASVTVIFGGQEQQTFQLDKPKMVVGREPTCEIHIDNLGISRNHCAFVNKNDAFVVQDLGSSNGTYVNGRKVNEHFLNDADEVIIGKYTLKFKNETQSAAPAQPAAGDAPAVPDTLNTYVMDGAKIQEQLAKMRASQGASGPTPAAPPVGATAKDYAKALDPAQGGGDAAASPADAAKFKTLVISLVAVVVVLIGFIIFMMLNK